jgi:hypothetical protein
MITLEEIAGYLLHKLKATLSQKGKFNLDSEYPNDYANKVGVINTWTICENEIGGILEVAKNYSFDFCEIDEVDIYLRPLSDLTKEIEHNGEKFVPIVELAKIAYPKVKPETIHLSKSKSHCFIDSYDKYSFGYCIPEASFICTYIPENRNCFVNNQLQLFQKLYEWHFDIHGLIERGDAIDINTLT